MEGELVMSEKPERLIQEEITKYLKTLKEGKLIRNNGTGVMIRGRLMKQSQTLPDILFLYKGMAFYFEIKNRSEHEFIKKHLERLREGSFNNENRKLNIYRNQIIIIEEINSTGNHASFVSSVDDVKTALHDS